MDLADRLKVSPATILNWEKDKTDPSPSTIPAIINFIGYQPFPEPKTLSERMHAKRRAKGWTSKEAAGQLGVDEGTWRRWEKEGIRWTRYRAMVEHFLKKLDN